MYLVPNDSRSVSPLSEWDGPPLTDLIRFLWLTIMFGVALCAGISLLYAIVVWCGL